MNLKAIKGKNVIVKALDQYHSDVLIIPDATVDRAGNLTRCEVLSSGFDDIPVGAIVHCKSELGYRIPMTNNRLYLREDILLIEDFPAQLTKTENSDDVTEFDKSKARPK